MENIHQLIHDIRDIVNLKNIKDDLIGDTENWFMLCSSMDMIEDTEMAIQGYQQIKEPIILDLNYLLFFGVFQAMFVQQDALKNLYRSFGFHYELPSSLENIREIRNDSIGHPTKRDGRNKTSNFIGRPTIKIKGFMLSLYYPEGSKPTRRDVNIPEQINIQRKVIANDLSALLGKIISKYKLYLDIHSRE